MAAKDKTVDKNGNRKIAVRICSSAGCIGNENGCSNGDCRLSNHFSKTARWTYWTEKHFIKIFGRKPNN